MSAIRRIATKIPERLLRTSIRPLGDASAWNRLLRRVNPVWSTNRVLARVDARIDESTDTLSLWLSPNRLWPGHRPGQHVALGVEIDGVLRQRVFSLSSAPGDHRGLRITLRRQPGEGVTNWLHGNARVGQIVQLSKPSGQFVLPEPTPQALLMIAGGSGITPMMAMLGQLAAAGHRGNIVLLQLYRGREQQLFSDELAQLQQQLPGLRLLAHDSALGGRLGAPQIEALVPDLAAHHSLLCGPAALMTAVSAMYAERGLSSRLQQEHFAAPRPDPLLSQGLQHRVHALNAEQTFTQPAGMNLLQAAEMAGLQPRHGCRAGLCRTCLCHKKSGRVRNLLTGLRSAEPDEWIQLCVSVAETELELAL